MERERARAGPVARRVSAIKASQTMPALRLWFSRRCSVTSTVSRARRRPHRGSLGEQHSQAVDAGVAHLMNRSAVDALGQQVAASPTRSGRNGCSRSGRCGAETIPRETDRKSNRCAGPPRRARATVELSCCRPRAAVCGQRVALHDDHRRPDPLQDRAQLEAQVVVRGS